MPTNLTSLPAQCVISFQGVPGTRLHVLRGRIWVTQANDLQDHFLHEQQYLELKSGHVVIEAGEESQYTLTLSDSNPPHQQNGSVLWRAWWPAKRIQHP